MFVSLLGTMGGVVLAVWLLDAIVALAPREIPRIADVALNWRLAAAAVGVGLLAGLLAGLVPAWQFSRPRSPESLGSGRGSTAHRTGRLVRDGLATAEIALAVALVVGAGLLLRSFTTLVAVNPGFRSDGVLALQVFAWDRQDSPARQQAFFRDTIADLGALPGVVDVGAVSAMPLIDANINVQGPYTIEGRSPLPSGEQDIASLTVATPGYFSVMDIPVVRGRTFTLEDRTGSEPVAVVSEAFAEHHWPGADPLGSWIVTRFSGQPQRIKIVGVVGELRHDSLDQPGREEIFLPLDQVGFGSITYVIRTSGDPAPLAETAKQAIWRHDPLLTFYDTKTVDELVSASVAPRRFSLVLVGAFAVVALVLAAAGIYGVLSFTTQRQTREFGVRMAMGATSREIARLVIGRGVRLGLIGLAIGVGAAIWAGRSMQSMLYEVSPFDPVTFGSVSAIALGISVLACYVPARRAMRVDPLVALRD
jgi:predicted permease